MGFPLINSWVRLEIIMVIFLKSKQTSIGRISNVAVIRDHSNK